MRKLTDDELAAIRKDNQRTLYGGGERQREISSLFAHIAARDAEIERLRAALEAIATNAPDADPSNDVTQWMQNAWKMWIAGIKAKEALARLAGDGGGERVDLDG